MKQKQANAREARSTPVRPTHRKKPQQHSNRNLAKLKRAEETLRASETNLAALIENPDASIWSVDQTYRLIIGNSKFRQSIREGLGWEIRPGDSVLQNIPQARQDEWRGYYDRALRGEKFSVETETCFLKSARHMEYRFNPIQYADGSNVGVTVYGRDITECKRAVEALGASEEKYRLLSELTSDYAFSARIEPDGTFVDEWVSDAFYRSTGYTLEDLHSDGIERILHPDDRQAIRRIFRDHSQPTLNVEVRLLTKEGEVRWVRGSVQRIRDQGERGSAHMIGAVKDVTEQKLAEEAARQHAIELEREVRERERAQAALQVSQNYAQSIINSSLDMIIAVDQQRKITEFNPAAEETFGYTRAEVLGQDVSILYADPNDGTAINRAVVESGRGECEVSNRKKNGETFPGMLAASVVHDPTGNPIGVMGVSRDISERKRAEEALQRYANEQAALYQIALRLSRYQDLPTLLQAIVEQAVELMHAQAGCIYVHESARTQLRLSVAAGFMIQYVGLTLKTNEGLAGRAFQTRTTQKIDDLHRHGHVETLAHDSRYQVVLAIPLHGSKDILGVLSLVRSDSVRAFSEQEVRVTELFAVQAASVMENALLYRAEHEQRELAQALSEVNAALTNSLDLASVLDRILDLVDRLVPHDAANIMLIEDGLARVARSRGYERWNVTDMSHIAFEIDSTSQYGKMTGSKQPVVIADTRIEPGWVTVPESSWVRACVLAPIRVREETLGFLNVDSATPGFFDESHAARLHLLADQAAVALSNARLFQASNIAAERLQALSHHLVQAQEVERTRIARELHDEIGQALTSLMVDLHFVEQNLDNGASTRAHIAEMKRGIDKLLENLHRLTVNLRPVALDHLGLVAALRQYTQEMQEQAGIEVQFQALGISDQRLPAEIETAFYRIAQESLTNVRRHAHATRAEVVLTQRGHHLVLMVWDNGVGFDPKMALQSGRLGLTSMRERATMLGGTIWIESNPGEGTTLHVEVPYGDSHCDRG